MTDLTKPVSRRVTLFLDHRITARAKDRITVTLFPDATVGFKPFHSRKDIRLPLVVAYKLALQHQAKEAETKRIADAKAAGKKIRKRKRSLLIFGGHSL